MRMSALGIFPDPYQAIRETWRPLRWVPTRESYLGPQGDLEGP